MNDTCKDCEAPTLGDVISDYIWNGKRWQPLRGRDMRDCFYVNDGYFWPLEAHADEIKVEDIARGLANEARYGNQSPYFYSVAWHTVALSYVVPPHLQKWALVHDAAESYLCDIPRVLKQLGAFDVYREAESKLLIVIAGALGMEDVNEPEELKSYDVLMSHTEMLVMYGDYAEAKLRHLGYTDQHLIEARADSHLIKNLDPEQAYAAWMDRYAELFGK